jgi:hypothetical protein
MEREHATSGSLGLLLDYGGIRYLSANELGSTGKGGNLPSIRIHPGPPSPHFFFPLAFPHRGHANATSRPVSGVCSTRFILCSRLQLPLYSLSPPPLNLDCDWGSSPCDPPTSCLVSTLYPVLGPPSPSGASNISVTHRQ